MGISSDMERSTTTAFCLSCHTMDSYGKSLYIDDANHIPAAHFQNHRVDPEHACYTCHTDYALFGTLKVKIGGLRHVYVYYLGTPPAPENIKLYQPFNNANCLHCHAGARSFEEGATHNADPATMVADVVPILGSFVSAGVGLFALISAVCLSLVTIALSWLAYRPMLAGGLFVVAAGCIALLIHRRQPVSARAQGH